ncbi:MAG: YbjN domain-containing protein [Arachnia sp.]
MGFFSKDGAVTAIGDAPRPLSRDRIKQILEQLEVTYSVDSDADIGAGWEEGSFFFLVEGQSEELLCVRGQWRGRLTAGEYPEAVMACNEWNQQTRWPKTYARESEGSVFLNAELNVDLEGGVTDTQLRQQLQCVIATGLDFFEKLNTKFPAAWEQYRPQA